MILYTYLWITNCHLNSPGTIPPPLVSLDPVLTVAAGGAYSTFGRALVLGQLDGDDLPDLVVGAPGAATAGCVYIFFGRSFLVDLFLVDLFW